MAAEPAGEVCPICEGLLGGCAILEGLARPDCPAPLAPAPVTFDQVGCARCDANGHAGMTFQPLTHPIQAGEYVFTHWALCPTNGEPLLLWVGDPKDAPGG